MGLFATVRRKKLGWALYTKSAASAALFFARTRPFDTYETLLIAFLAALGRSRGGLWSDFVVCGALVEPH